MKKLVALVLALVLCMGVTAAFADRLGFGSVTGLGSHSSEGNEDAYGVIQVETTYCAVLVDDEGRIVDIKFDVAQNSFNFDNEGKFYPPAEDFEFPTKLEKGDAYGMKNASAIGLDWYEQAAGLEAWLVGKTVDEFRAAVDAGDETLLAVCSINANAFVEAAAKAVANALAE